jgi:hypothetical protein
MNLPLRRLLTLWKITLNLYSMTDFQKNIVNFFITGFVIIVAAIVVALFNRDSVEGGMIDNLVRYMLYVGAFLMCMAAIFAALFPSKK